MTPKLCRLLRAMSTVALLPVWGAALMAQQPEGARITGRVADAEGAGLPAATVAIPDLGLGATTGADGGYSIAVPSGRIQNQVVAVTARAIGYKPQSVQLTLREGMIAQDFALTANPLLLGELVQRRAGFGVIYNDPRSADHRPTRLRRVAAALRGRRRADRQLQLLDHRCLQPGRRPHVW
jgi:hypothetical protein